MRNDGYEEKGGGQKIVVECLQFWPEPRPSHLSGLDLNCGVKGQREHLRETGFGYHTHSLTHRQVNTQICVRVSLLQHTHIIQAHAQDICIYHH